MGLAPFTLGAEPAPIGKFGLGLGNEEINGVCGLCTIVISKADAKVWKYDFQFTELELQQHVAGEGLVCSTTWGCQSQARLDLWAAALRPGWLMGNPWCCIC